ncbi:hypothetical protein [Halomonas sp. PBN3]|uniref:hypothetical protein n=1 Tax=Halomonas sp. PBN3 TaxID=1397528 RepID=UPI0012678714|nr:hypothetical protein [Halomonas sp. PBN3]
MYKKIDKYLPRSHGLMYVDGQKLPSLGPPEEGDTVTVKVDESVELYIRIYRSEGDELLGEIVAIGPAPRADFGGYNVGDLVEVEVASITAIIRED